MRAPPAGRMPTVARIYLSFLLVLMLVLVAMHFYLQVWSQQQARAWISTWEHTYHAHVGEVRLRMLRGALSLKDVQWQSADMQLYVPDVLLRGNVSDELSQVKILDMSLNHAELKMSKKRFEQLRHNPEKAARMFPWSGMLTSLRHFHSKHMSGWLQENFTDMQQPQLHIHQANCSAQPQQDTWQCRGNIEGDGTFQVSSSHQHGELTWLNVEASPLMKAVNLSPLDGQLSGELTWQKAQVSGKIDWNNGLQSAEQRLGHMVGHAQRDASDWLVNLHLNDFPVQFLAHAIPRIDGRALVAGYVQAAVHLKGRAGHWQLQADEAKLQQLRYQKNTIHHDQSNESTIDTLTLKGFVLNEQTAQLHIDRVDLQGGNWGFSTPSTDQNRLTSPPPIWHLDLPDIQLSKTHIGDRADDLWLADMAGKGAWQGSDWQVDLHSQSDLEGQWHILLARHASAEEQEDTAVNITIEAQKAPLLMFRTLLPERLEKGAGLRGDLDIALQGQWKAQNWQLHGDVKGKQLRWNRSVWLWQVDHLMMQNLKLSSEQPPHIESMQMDDWSGQASLQPWLHTDNPVKQAEREPFWFADWQIEKLHMGSGYFSLGQSDQIWLTNQSIDFSPIHLNQPIEIHAQGTLAEGDFQWRGAWFPWGASPWLSVTASVQHALPFIANDWLTLSGLPGFTQGRMSASLNLSPVADHPLQYQGNLAVKLAHAELKQNLVSNSQLEKLTGYAPHALLDRLTSADGVLQVAAPLSGEWLQNPLSGGMLGDALLQTLAAPTELNDNRAEQGDQKTVTLSRIRLHDNSGEKIDHLKHNERVRLRSVMRSLQKHPTWHIVLWPQLGQEQLDKVLIDRIRDTQRQIEAFLVERGIAVARIVPALPEEIQRSGDMTGILIQAQP